MNLIPKKIKIDFCSPDRIGSPGNKQHSKQPNLTLCLFCLLKGRSGGGAFKNCCCCIVPAAEDEEEGGKAA